MARKVKLQDTQEYGMSDTAFRGDDGKYYSTESAYIKFAKNKEYRQKCIDAMFDVMGYKEKMLLPTLFYKKLQDFEGVGYEALYYTFKSQHDSIQWALKNKQFNSETSKVMYIVAILNNSVMDEYKKLQREEYRSAKNQKIAEAYEGDVIEVTSMPTSKSRQDKSKILNLVGDIDE